MSSYFEHVEGKPQLRAGDVIEWDPPKVNFEFHSGVCVESSPAHSQITKEELENIACLIATGWLPIR